jgi:hypothetical protein
MTSGSPFGSRRTFKIEKGLRATSPEPSLTCMNCMVELRGLEPLASCMPCKRSTS